MLKLFCYLFYHWNLNLIFFLFWLLPWAMCSAGVSHDKGGSHILWLCTWSNYILRLLIWMAWWNSIWHTTDDEDCILAKYILCTSLTAYLNSFKSFLQCVKKKKSRMTYLCFWTWLLCSYHNFLTSSSMTITFKNGKHLRKFSSPQTPAKTQAVRLCHVKGSRRLMGPERDPWISACK